MKSYSGLLSLALPTFGRAQFLDAFLSIHLPILHKYNVQLIISDNASNDNTLDVVQKYLNQYSVIKFYCNKQTESPDRNFEIALGYADTEYVWLIGDTYQVDEETVKAVLDTISSEVYDLVVINQSGRVKGIEPKIYIDRNRLLSEIGWHMTCIGTMIYSKDLLTKANYGRYNDTNFLQIGIAFEYLADKPMKVRWMPEHSVIGLSVSGVKKTSWEDQAFEIWSKRWPNFVFSLPASYSLYSKMKCIMDHGENGKGEVFSFKNLIRWRRKNILTIDVYKRYHYYFPLTIQTPRFVIFLISVLPRVIFASSG
jgi:glycosyltransferase involved in cell wall biosynthesis